LIKQRFACEHKPACSKNYFSDSKMIKKFGWSRLIALTLVLFMSACSGGENDELPPPSIPTEVPNEAARLDLTAAAGGQIEITDPASPLAGVKIKIPARCAFGRLAVASGF
jgi:hypothetical protein